MRSSTLPLGYGGSPQYWALQVDGEETFIYIFNLSDCVTHSDSSKNFVVVFIDLRNNSRKNLKLLKHSANPHSQACWPNLNLPLQSLLRIYQAVWILNMPNGH